MNRDDVIRIADEANSIIRLEIDQIDKDFLQEFANLIASHVAEECAKACEERAAMTYDEISDKCDTPQQMTDLECHECAAKIRSLYKLTA